MNAKFLVFAAMVTAIGECAYGAITADIQPSRISGVAPLGVFFDATGTTSTTTIRPFHEVSYQWDFDDPTSGNWNSWDATSSTWGPGDLSKNQARGPHASHVFEKPGSYDVLLNTMDSNGNTATKQVTIDVQDPDVVFAGTNTVCFSGSGDFGGCPAGAQQVTTSNFNTAMTHAAPGKRLLLHRGEQWTAASSANLVASGPNTLAAYGNSADSVPRITFSNVGGDSLTADGCRIGESSIWNLKERAVPGRPFSGVIAEQRIC